MICFNDGSLSSLESSWGLFLAPQRSLNSVYRRTWADFPVSLSLYILTLCMQLSPVSTMGMVQRATGWQCL